MTGQAEPGERYRVTLRFAEDANGPATAGYWTNPDTALRIYRSWVGTYGSTPAHIEICEQAGDDWRILRSWTRASGEARPTRD
ncbi:hypothetical protein ACIQU6_30585 [Streptomyces sp. NPDC090442]|uniref:hypothetical protein n=1 Tax=Streptomyces sp. NPDC090442 TaxID=3365962 RepID=UPI0037FB503D